jgi:hypothetical protein
LRANRYFPNLGVAERVRNDQPGNRTDRILALTDGSKMTENGRLADGQPRSDQLRLR